MLRSGRKLFTVALLLGASALCPGGASAQSTTTPAYVKTVRDYANSHRKEIITEYIKLLSLPNTHGDVPALKRNADYLAQMLKAHGLQPEVWDTSGGVPVVFAQKLVPGAKHTILLYAHYDGQPVDPKRWAQPDPWGPVMRTDTIDAGGQIVTDLANGAYPDQWRLYARSAGDDKVPIQAMMSALDALHGRPKENIKIFLHGEEEGSGPGQAEVIAKYADKLKSDLLVILDGPQHASGQPTIYYGARGGINMDVTVITAKQSMHSGNYGNWMPDANVRLSQLISSMVDKTGKVVIPGFYSDSLPFSAESRAMMDAVPDRARKMQDDFGVGMPDGAATSLQEGINMDAFSIHTMEGGEVGGVIAARASAQIAIKLVKETDPQTMVNRVLDFIKAQDYLITDKDPDVATLASHPRVIKVSYRLPATGTGAWRTDPNDPQAQFATDALRAAWGKDKVVRIRTLGAGVPAAPFITAYNVPTVGVSIANYDDNQHSDNENLRIGNLFDGMVTVAALMMH